MQTILDTLEIASVGIHNVSTDDFNTLMLRNKSKLVDLKGYWMTSVKIGLIQIDFFAAKEKCLCCKKADVDDPRVDFCAGCFEELEEREAEERARNRREDAYDASRGH